MNQGTKQRIVGTVVLIALALIFLPLVFDGEGNYQQALESRIPSPPIVEVMRDPIPTRPTIQADAVISLANPEPDTQIEDESLLDNVVIEESIPVPDNSPDVVPTQDVESQTPVLDTAGLPVGWSVRLGSFANVTNAEGLRQRLLTAGYQAYSREFTSNQRRLTSVFVGPQAEREKAEQLKSELQGRYQLAGIIVRFEVESFP